MKLLLFGTPEFSVTIFNSILNSRHKISGIVTQPDRTGGRGLKLIEPQTKIFAKHNNLPFFQPQNFKDQNFRDSIARLVFDSILVVAYGNYIPSSIFNLSKRDTINIHPSLLPKYRGASPINWAIMNGDKTTGITFHKLVKEMDAGDIIFQREFSIDENDDAILLTKKLSILASKHVVEVIDSVENSTFVSVKQDETRVTLAPLLTKEMARIDWTKSASTIHNMVRALKPWPIAHTTLRGELIKIYKSEFVVQKIQNERFGKIIEKNEIGIYVNTGDGVLIIKELQRENRRIATSLDFINGYKEELEEFF